MIRHYHDLPHRHLTGVKVVIDPFERGRLLSDA